MCMSYIVYKFTNIINNKIIQVYNSMSEVLNNNNIALFRISYVCFGKQEIAGNYKWRIVI